MEKYNKYKDSGIEWIGEIPEHWEVKRLKQLAKICNGQDHKNVWDENGTYPIIGTGGEFGKANKFLHKGPSVILGRKGTIDKPQYIEVPFWSVDTAYYTEIRPKYNPRLFFYLCKTINFDLYKYGSAVPSMTQEVLSQIPFSIPNSLQEQSTIANYLDRKTAQIDELIADKKRLLELYEEEKTAIINQAVTKGINPNAPMKDSGIEWFGEIPEHWQIANFNHYVFLRHGYQFRNFDFTSDGIKIIKITQLLSSGKFETENVSFIDENRLDNFKDILIKEGDILMALTGGTIGKIIRVPKVNEPLLQNYRVGNFFPINQQLSKDFLFWILSSNSILAQIFYDQRETGQPNIGKEDFGKMKIVFPKTIEEQTEIVKYIEAEIYRIDAKSEKTKKLIELLAEYRTALISEVVTGKIKVI